jgi:hypothetical protein
MTDEVTDDEDARAARARRLREQIDDIVESAERRDSDAADVRAPVNPREFIERHMEESGSESEEDAGDEEF